MLLLVHVHVRFGFGMDDTIGRIVEKWIDWKQTFNYRCDPFATSSCSFAQQPFLCLFRLAILEHPNIKWQQKESM